MTILYIFCQWVVARTDFNQAKKGRKATTAKDTNYTRQALEEASRMVARGQNQGQASQQQAVPQAQPSSFMPSSYERTHGGTQPAASAVPSTVPPLFNVPAASQPHPPTGAYTFNSPRPQHPALVFNSPTPGVLPSAVLPSAPD
jgi:hypothetical protein